MFFGCRDGHFYALDARTGGRKWAHDNKKGWVIASPAVEHGVVYFPTSDGERFKALDAATGATIYDISNKAKPELLTVWSDGGRGVHRMTYDRNLKYAYLGADVKGYNGVDWNRRVLWNKGNWFLVQDTIAAREAGRYDLDLTWKTIDRGNQRVDAAGRFVARRADGGQAGPAQLRLKLMTFAQANAIGPLGATWPCAPKWDFDPLVGMMITRSEFGGASFENWIVWLSKVLAVTRPIPTPIIT